MHGVVSRTSFRFACILKIFCNVFVILQTYNKNIRTPFCICLVNNWLGKCANVVFSRVFGLSKSVSDPSNQYMSKTKRGCALHCSPPECRGEPALHYDTSSWRLPLSDCCYLKRHAQQVLEKAGRDERGYAGIGFSCSAQSQTATRPGR